MQTVYGAEEGAQVPSPIPGKMKNCSDWAQYEMRGTSSTATLCHGGRFEGKLYQPCPARYECQHATMAKTRSDGQPVRSLPVMNPTGIQQLRPIVSQTPVSQQQAPTFRPMTFGGPTTLPASAPRALQSRAFPGESTFPQPIVPPEDYPASMRTPYASATHVYGGGTSPTFLPRDGENVFDRLIKNIVQGALAACGWHIFDYARSVDLFR